jgi:tetratricopeptide (TPR) repeat protein
MLYYHKKYLYWSQTNESNLIIINRPEMIPEMILVGISNTEAASSYMPVNSKGETNEGLHFTEFLSKELIPYIDQNYRTENFRILYGQSNTGLFTVYVLLTEPSLFNAYIAASPSLGWCLDFMKEKVKEAFSMDRARFNNEYLYMNYGGKDIQWLVSEPLLDFYEFLENSAPKGLNLLLETLPKDGHVPVTSLNNGLLFIFPDFLASDDLKAQGFEAKDRHFAALSKRYGLPLQAPEEVIFDMCYTPIRSKKYSEAIELFKVLLERYPASLRGYFFMGEAYRYKGELMQAEKMYKKCLELDTDFQRAKARLETLHKME